jgi:hypothetical protein
LLTSSGWTPVPGETDLPLSAEFHDRSAPPDVNNSGGLLLPDGLGSAPLAYVGAEDDSWCCDEVNHEFDDDDGSSFFPNNGSFSPTGRTSPRLPNSIIMLFPPSIASVHASRTSRTAIGAASTKLKTESIRGMQATILYRRILVGCITWYRWCYCSSCSLSSRGERPALSCQNKKERRDSKTNGSGQEGLKMGKGIDWPAKSEWKGIRTIQYPAEQTEEVRKYFESRNLSFMLTPSSVRSSISDGSPQCYSASTR